MDNYVGEIRAFAYNKIPRGWLPCNGQTLQWREYQLLAVLLQNRYGGQDTQTFNLPDLRGRFMMHFGLTPFMPVSNYHIGQAFGSETMQLTTATIPAHTHEFALVKGTGTVQLDPATAGVNYLSSEPEVPVTTTELIQAFVPALGAAATTLHPDSVTSTGAGQPHENRMPYLPVSLCIATSGIWPFRQ